MEENEMKNEEKNVDQKFREIDKLFDKFSEKNHEQLSNAEIKPIHEKYPFAQNIDRNENGIKINKINYTRLRIH